MRTGRDLCPRGVNGARERSASAARRRRLDPSQGAWTRRRHTDGAAAAAPLIRLARFYEASRPRPRSPPRGAASLETANGLGAGCPSQRLRGRRTRSDTPSRACQCAAPARRREDAASPGVHERTPQIAARPQRPHSSGHLDCAPAEPSSRSDDAGAYDLRLTTYDLRLPCFT